MNSPVAPLLSLLAIACLAGVLAAQPVPPPNYDESRVPIYTLPDPLRLANGQRVTDAATWRTHRRPEIVRLFDRYVYGKAPGKPEGMTFEVRSRATDALGGRAIRKQVVIHIVPGGKGPAIHLLIYLPKTAKGPPPLFLGLNFDGNQSVHDDPAIAPSDKHVMPAPHSAGPSAKKRGADAHCWPVEKILARGYGLATAWYGDIEPDRPDGLPYGVRQLYLKPGQTRPAKDEWGALAAWAWGLSRIMDYLQADPELDSQHVALIGHSRLGKAALWAGAQDERFALVISNESGCGGASLARRRYGETPARITTSFPYWFCGNYRDYAFTPDALPVDQHMLLALVAPRPLYVASAQDDRWSDPRGAFLSAKAADPVYRLLGVDGLPAAQIPAAEMPPLEKPLLGGISYHIRRGKHDVTGYDWQCYLDCADRCFNRPSPPATP